MSYLVRKINIAKWPKENIKDFQIEDLRADAITCCLKTSEDTLSTWEIDSIEKLSEAILALASAFQRLDKMDVIILDKSEVENRGFEIINSDGRTPVEDLVDTHKDIAGLNYKKIGEFSQLILDSMSIENRVIRYTATKIKKLLQSEIAKGRVDPMNLHEGLRNKITA